MPEPLPGLEPVTDLDRLRDKVKPYGRHVLVATGRADWPGHVEEEKSLLGEMARDVKGLADAVRPPPKLTALATRPAGDGPHPDVLVYPDAVAYRGVDADAWGRIRDAHLRAGRVVRDLHPEPLHGLDVLVCAHGARDDRCGNCGPLVAGALARALQARGRRDVRVHVTSHVGGHKFAGNVIVYPGGAWYGYVRPNDAAALLDALGEDGRGVWESHLRGRGGVLEP